MSNDQDTKPPPRPRGRLPSSSGVVVREINAAPPRRESYDQPDLTRELERLERGRIHALTAAQDALAAAEDARAQAEDARRQAVAAAPTPAAITRAQWHEGAFKFLGALTALLVAATVALGAWTSAQGARLDSARQRAQAQDDTAGTLAARIKARDDYFALLKVHTDCVNAERDSAIERGTGHAVEGRHDGIEWVQQSKPPAKLKVPWDPPPWLTRKDKACPAEPDYPK